MPLHLSVCCRRQRGSQAPVGHGGSEVSKRVQRHSALCVTIFRRTTLDSLVVKLFGDVQRRWLETTFPFTHPSMEAEIFFKGAWLEVCECLCFSAMSNEPEQVLGCGAIRSDILQATAVNSSNRDFCLTVFGRPLVAGIGGSRSLYHFQRKRISCDTARAGWGGLSASVSSD